MSSIIDVLSHIGDETVTALIMLLTAQSHTYAYAYNTHKLFPLDGHCWRSLLHSGNLGHYASNISTMASRCPKLSSQGLLSHDPSETLEISDPMRRPRVVRSWTQDQLAAYPIASH